MTRPPCHNRPPRAAGSWEPTGSVKLRPGRHDIPGDCLEPAGAMIYKPVYRFRPSAFEDRCATWDGRGIGPKGEPYPQAHGWDCNGCRWLPPHLSTAEPAPTAREILARATEAHRAAVDGYAARVAEIERDTEAFRLGLIQAMCPPRHIDLPNISPPDVPKADVPTLDLPDVMFDDPLTDIGRPGQPWEPGPNPLFHAGPVRLTWREDTTTCQRTLNELEKIQAKLRGEQMARMAGRKAARLMRRHGLTEETVSWVTRLHARLARWYT